MMRVQWFASNVGQCRVIADARRGNIRGVSIAGASAFQPSRNHNHKVAIQVGEAGRQVWPRQVKLINGMDACSVERMEIASASDAIMSGYLTSDSHCSSLP